MKRWMYAFSVVICRVKYYTPVSPVITMFEPVNRNILRWGTPDPEGDWIMYGHIVHDEQRCIMIDPPLVPGLIESTARLGKLEAVILTTLDHTRGAKYITEKTGATLFIPDQVKSTCVDPEAVLAQKGIREFQKYSNGDLLGLKPYRVTAEDKSTANKPWMDEFALLVPQDCLIVGDVAIGTAEGNIILAPEWFPHIPPHPAHPPVLREFSKVVLNSGATSLLASHGNNVYGHLREILR
ncbi:MAG: hypothetical protein M1476_06880 [Candidatus Thermoplasmatota archaeon]|nr:hypothetical protein [Candidatus Thermoplasmatota archaeon]